MSIIKTNPYIPAKENNSQQYNGQERPIVEAVIVVDDQDSYPRITKTITKTITTQPPVVKHHHTGASVEYPRYIDVGSRKPVVLTYCPQCAKEHVTTTTRTKVTGTTWICVAVGIIIFWPLFWVPLVARPMKQTNHYCSSCGTKVGRIKPFQ
jgi:predicted RNA-binding Zn-ribbon protein involved in translation (DUF1610 family)